MINTIVYVLFLLLGFVGLLVGLSMEGDQNNE